MKCHRIGSVSLGSALLAFFGMALTMTRGAPPTNAQEKTEREEKTAPDEASKEEPKADADGLISLDPEGNVKLDKKKKELILNGTVCLIDGMLEMFACPERTKEHESIVAVAGEARVIHAGLLAAGAKPGHPAQWRPEYKPAEGTEIEITMKWVTEDGEKKEARAQELVREVKSGEAMKHSWVFGGSELRKDEKTGATYYLAEGGELICLSNFSTAMLDLPIESSDAERALLFEAYTERLPPRGTKVQLVLSPKDDAKEGEGETKDKPAGEKEQAASKKSAGDEPAAKPSTTAKPAKPKKAKK